MPWLGSGTKNTWVGLGLGKHHGPVLEYLFRSTQAQMKFVPRSRLKYLVVSQFQMLKCPLPPNMIVSTLNM